ncbi:aldo/keto reductase [Pseudoalteromonas xiamenensis]|uniref:aldo/keto reductase n=1 Tax=Pseudoalteromonas xiamenensis TaxID=882626 RepID=UPI0027E43C71|nr:aldo/keto reductase [Pseudoalteromonas xiamenensis]WMN58792.1 aldo/keto reductase [Pseudoalteromonas xiamenensis]
MKTITLKHLDKTLPNLGLGCMGMSEFYGTALSQTDALNVMQTAYDSGVRMFDTADFYGDGDNERLIGQFIKRTHGDLVVATKCGIVRGKEVMADGNFRREYNNRPEYIKQACEQSLQRLGVECIDLFYLHRIDPNVPIEESVGALSELVKAGKIKAIGLSEADPSTLERAHKVHPISALQTEYSIWSRGVEEHILPKCRELGITFVAYSPLGRGMVPRSRQAARFDFEPTDFRLSLERATSENMHKNQHLYDLLYDISDGLGITPFQLMLAWLMAQGDDVLPIPGSTKSANILSNVRAAQLALEPSLVAQLSEAFLPTNVAGGRYTVNKEVAANAAEMK